jgi:hypothetical protein
MSNPGPNITQTVLVTQENVGPDGHLYGATAAALQAFWGAAPVAQPASPAGNVHTPTPGSTTAVYVNTTFDGSIGSTAYTLGDIVKALKTIGIIAS